MKIENRKLLKVVSVELNYISMSIENVCIVKIKKRRRTPQFITYNSLESEPMCFLLYSLALHSKMSLTG